MKQALTVIIIDMLAKTPIAIAHRQYTPQQMADAMFLHREAKSIIRELALNVSDMRIAWAIGTVSLEYAITHLPADVLTNHSSVEEWELSAQTSIMRVDQPRGDRN